MNELLSPAGTLDAYHAAISNGCDAIYLGLDKFSARAYATNFTLENFKELLDFAHLRNVKIYVTINTIIYDNELEEVYRTIDKLAEYGADGIIVQDLAVFNYIVNNYKSLPAHVSTQMGIDDFEGAKFMKELGAKRIVFARETNIETLKRIKDELGIEVEAFIHGALCVSYSGNCLMSSMMGDRSGNRGRCAGCCRKVYTLVDSNSNKEIIKGYLLSMKDLNVSNNINQMRFIDSFKIEGRMKEPNYVASVTRYYRNLIDNEKVDKESLFKVFNRTYTKGFINNEDAKVITNINKPNNFGYEIGLIEKKVKNKIWIRLNKELSKGDQIRVDADSIFEEISLPVTKMFDNNLDVILSSNKLAVIECDKHVRVGAKVYKTKDAKFVEAANRTLLNKEYKKLDVDMEFIAELNRPLLLKVKYSNSVKAVVKSDAIIEAALAKATTEDNIRGQLSKLNDTPYKLRNLSINMDDDLFIPLKTINELRREAIEKINSQRIERVLVRNTPKEIVPKEHKLIDPEITVEVSNEEQYEVAKELGIKHIYFRNIVTKNHAKYDSFDGEVLVGGLGGIGYYKDKNTVVSNSSMNVVNYKSVAILSSLGVDRITLSEEINKDNINKLIENYVSEYHTFPNLELIVYGRSKLMHTKYCPLRRLGMCGKCKEGNYELKDDYASFPLKFNGDCTITLLNSKTLNIIDDLDGIKGVNYYRAVFTTESREETKYIIEALKEALLTGRSQKSFNKDIHTRGHFIKNPL